MQAGFRTSAGVPYTPAGYPDHGGGIFAVGVEATGDVAVVALRATGEATLLASVPTGLRAVMEVVWSPVRGELWAQCDNGCDGRAAVMRPTGGSFVTETIVEPPAGLARLNLEGFALGRTCSGGTMTAVWSDDSATDGHALRQSTVSCATPAVGGTVTTARTFASRTLALSSR